VPAAPGAVTALIVVAFTTTVLDACTLPMVTKAPAAKFVPTMVSAVPPVVGPELGETLVIVGVAGGGSVSTFTSSEYGLKSPLVL
jgi:hypothetical protein